MLKNTQAKTKKNKMPAKKAKDNLKKNNNNKTKKGKSFIFNDKDYNSGHGMNTKIWGPPDWLFIHTLSFNYPVEPTKEDKKHYKDFIENLKYVLPCKHCRINLKKNLKEKPLTDEDLKNRKTFSTYIYELHELINTMLNKKSG